LRGLNFFLIGPGRVGTSLGMAWIRAGHRCVGVEGGRPGSLRRARRLLLQESGASSPRLPAPDFDLLVVATPDRAIASVARVWANRNPWRGRMALHLSGALPASELAPIQRKGGAVASLHPLTSLARAEVAGDAFRGVYFAVEGDPPAVRCALRLARSAGGRTLRIPAESKAFYHLCACLVSGYLLGIVDQAAGGLVSIGVDRSSARAALLELAESAIRNARWMGPGKALTGPVVRGDLVTLSAHLRSLRRRENRWKRLHNILTELSLDLACREGRISKSVAADIRQLYRKEIRADLEAVKMHGGRGALGETHAKKR